jgi:hypothetical protein
LGSDRDMSSNYNMHFSFEKSSQKFTVFHKRNITSSQVTTHLKNYLGEQNNRRTTEKENGWNPPFYRIPFPTHEEDPFPPKGCWGRMRNISGRWGRISPLPQQTGTSNPFPQKDADGACATSVDAGGASDPPPPQQTGTSNPFPQKDAESACATWVDAGGASAPSPKRPVRATPSPTDRYEQPLPPKRMLSAHAQHQWTLGAHQTPFPQETGTSNPFPLPPPYIKG